MSSAEKIAANRENARKSTGPRTERGKSKSRLNALKFGIHATTPVLPGEDVEAYRQIEKTNSEHFTPVGPVENMLVHQITIEQWRLERIQRAELLLHARMKEGQIVKFIASLNVRESCYVLATYGGLLCEELLKDHRAKWSAFSEKFKGLQAKLPESLRIKETDRRSDDHLAEEIETRLGEILDPDNTLLDQMIPITETAPHNYLVQERRAAVRAYMVYVSKLKDLQEARLTVTLFPQPRPTAKTHNALTPNARDGF